VQLAHLLAMLYREFPQTVLAEHPDLTELERQQRANDSLDMLVRDNPQLASAYLARYEYRAKYGLADGLADLEAALQLAPDDSAVQYAAALSAYERGVKLKRAANDRAEAQKQFEQSLSHYEQLLLRPVRKHLPEYYLGRGNVWLELGRIDQALSSWREGIQRFRKLTTQAAFYAHVADSCLEDEKLSDAREALNKIDEILDGLGNSVRRDEKSRLMWAQDLRRASWHIKRQELAEAVLLLRKVVTQTKGEANSQPAFRALLTLGRVYTALGISRDAAIAFDQASGLEPGFQPSRVSAANSWLNAGRADFAVERAEQALKIASTLEAWLALAVAQFQYRLS